MKIKKQISESEEKYDDCSQNVILFLGKYNKKNEFVVNEEQLNELFSHSPDEIAKQRAVIRKLEEAGIQAESSFNERNIQLKTHLSEKPTDHFSEELISLHTEYRNEIQKQNEWRSDIDFQLCRHKENVLKYQESVRELQAKSEINERWSKLNALIGSADGEKFRQIAQEYTLDILLTYANIHLKDLASRYQIERIFGTLALQVIDKDMGMKCARFIHYRVASLFLCHWLWGWPLYRPTE